LPLKDENALRDTPARRCYTTPIDIAMISSFVITLPFHPICRCAE